MMFFRLVHLQCCPSIHVLLFIVLASANAQRPLWCDQWDMLVEAAPKALCECYMGTPLCKHNPKLTVHNNYSGWRVPQNTSNGRPGKPHILEDVDNHIWRSQDFFADYILARRPALLRGFVPLGGAEWANVSRLRDIAHLKSRAGHEVVYPELPRISSMGPVFGSGNEFAEVSNFSEFLDAVTSGSENMYLTPQKQDEDENGCLELDSPPLRSLRGDFPAWPSLFSKLLPSAVNTWMGSSIAGTSSGLHHDVKDNLYVLVAGKKRMRLLGPHDAAAASLAGPLEKILPNGNLVYRGCPRREDSASRGEIQAICAQSTEQGASDSTEDAGPSLDASWVSSIANDNLNVDWQFVFPHVEDLVLPHFSQWGPDVLAACIDAGNCSDAEDLSGVAPAVVELEPGDALYLPAGWLHEVTSRSEHTSKKAEFHLALNYWAHPPSGQNVDNPYPAVPSVWPRLAKKCQAFGRPQRVDPHDTSEL